MPNLASSFGYTYASWPLKCDLTCDNLCRLLNHRKRTGLRQATPHNTDPTLGRESWLDFSSGYVQRAMEKFPKQGTRAPWKLHQNYALDLMNLKYASVADRVMKFSNPKSAKARAVQKAAA